MTTSTRARSSRSSRCCWRASRASWIPARPSSRTPSRARRPRSGSAARSPTRSCGTWKAALAMASQLDRAPASPGRARDLLGGQLARNADPRALVRGHVALYGSGSASEELERAAKACADAAGCVLTQHQSLDAADAAFDRGRFGEDALLHLAAIGVLGRNCSFMHMNALGAAERDAVVASGMTVIWHPGNVLYYGDRRRRQVRDAGPPRARRAGGGGDRPRQGVVLRRDGLAGVARRASRRRPSLERGRPRTADPRGGPSGRPRGRPREPRAGQARRPRDPARRRTRGSAGARPAAPVHADRPRRARSTR